MKKIIFLLIPYILVSSLSYGQYFREPTESTNQNLEYGIRAGVNVSWLRYSISGNTETTGTKIGFAAGGFMDYYFSNTVGIGTEVMFNSLGGRETVGNTSIQLGLHYITLPLFLKFNLGYFGNLYFGPQLGIFLGGKASSGGTSVSFNEGYTPTDHGLVIGGSNYLGERLILDSKFYFGLANIDTTTPGLIENNIGFQITLGILLNR